MVSSQAFCRHPMAVQQNPVTSCCASNMRKCKQALRRQRNTLAEEVKSLEGGPSSCCQADGRLVLPGLPICCGLQNHQGSSFERTGAIPPCHQFCAQFHKMLALEKHHRWVASLQQQTALVGASVDCLNLQRLVLSQVLSNEASCWLLLFEHLMASFLSGTGQMKPPTTDVLVGASAGWHHDPCRLVRSKCLFGQRLVVIKGVCDFA